EALPVLDGVVHDVLRCTHHAARPNGFSNSTDPRLQPRLLLYSAITRIPSQKSKIEKIVHSSDVENSSHVPAPPVGGVHRDGNSMPDAVAASHELPHERLCDCSDS